jgi:hypothetical protein
MAEGAVEFYKNGLPLLDKYLPHWMVPHIQRLLAAVVAGGAIALPLFSFAPKLVKSFVEYRLGSMYRRLRQIEALGRRRDDLRGVSARGRARQRQSGDPLARGSEATLKPVLLYKISSRTCTYRFRITSRRITEPDD